MLSLSASLHAWWRVASRSSSSSSSSGTVFIAEALGLRRDDWRGLSVGLREEELSEVSTAGSLPEVLLLERRDRSLRELDSLGDGRDADGIGTGGL